MTFSANKISFGSWESDQISDLISIHRIDKHNYDLKHNFVNKWFYDLFKRKNDWIEVLLNKEKSYVIRVNSENLKSEPSLMNWDLMVSVVKWNGVWMENANEL